eukprot:1900-Heterococcus_DN1.PRE.4
MIKPRSELRQRFLKPREFSCCSWHSTGAMRQETTLLACNSDQAFANSTRSKRPELSLSVSLLVAAVLESWCGNNSLRYQPRSAVLLTSPVYMK